MTDWRPHAACRDQVELFNETFDSSRRAHPRALAVCTACPVRRRCLQDALALEERAVSRHGLLGGLMPSQRERLARQDA